MLGVCLLGWAMVSAAEPLRLAVASNFVTTVQELTQAFSETTGHAVLISSGSTGQLYAQIKQGAPHDVFLAADLKRPQWLVDEGLAVGLEVYAIGTLQLYVREAPEGGCETWLSSQSEGFLAVANPALAPYGHAAQAFLQNQGHWSRWQERLVMGENIAQASHFVASGAAAAGLLAAATVRLMPPVQGSCQWTLPPQSHPPIEQAVVTLKRSQNPEAVAAFRRFLRSKPALEIIRAHGYRSGALDA
nr:molybdate ABC transporter substrate-binding protein [Marinicella sp. NBU2979]